MIKATEKRLIYIEEGMGYHGVQESLAQGMKTLLERFKEFSSSFEEKYVKFTNKQWRMIRKDLKMIERIDFKQWDSACMELNALANQKLFMYN